MVARVVAPASLAPRDWMLAVAAVQLAVTDSRVDARLRAHLTGEPEARVTLIDVSPAVVHVALVAQDQTDPPWPAIAPPALGEAAARLALFLDGVAAGEVSLAPGALRSSRPPRAFGHVFCRHRSDGVHDAGFDLTDFLAPPPGVKFERRVKTWPEMSGD